MFYSVIFIYLHILNIVLYIFAQAIKMSDTSESENDVQEKEDEGTPPKKMKSGNYKQAYKKEWEKEWNWIQSSKKGPVYAWYGIFCLIV